MPAPSSETNFKTKRLCTQVRGGWPQARLTIAIGTLQTLPPSSASDLLAASTRVFKASAHSCLEAARAARTYRKPPVLRRLLDRRGAREVRGARTRSMTDSRQSPPRLRRKNCHRSWRALKPTSPRSTRHFSACLRSQSTLPSSILRTFASPRSCNRYSRT